MQQIRVLWFANTPCSAVDKLGLNLNSGGWLRSLEQELQKVQEVNLAVCFYFHKSILPFMFNGIQYYPVFRQAKSSKIKRYVSRIFNSSGNDESEIPKLLKVIEQFNPAIIHVHGTEENFGLLHYFTNVPVIISIQGILSAYVEKYFSGIPYSKASRFEGILSKVAFSDVGYSFRQFKKHAERERKILVRAHNIIGRTDWDRRITHVLAPQSRYYIGNEILRSVFYSNIWSKKQFGDTIQIVTNMSGAFYKGFETIFRTAQVLKENTDLRFVWNIIGINEKNNIVKIVKRWKKANFYDFNIQLQGTQNEEEIVEILLGSDIYCQTSHIENSPNSLCEAMLLGMPIIATNAGGTCSILENNKEGIIVQDGDCFILAGSILELVENFNKAQIMGKYARDRALKRHNQSNILNELLEIYEFSSFKFYESNFAIIPNSSLTIS